MPPKRGKRSGGRASATQSDGDQSDDGGSADALATLRIASLAAMASVSPRPDPVDAGGTPNSLRNDPRGQGDPRLAAFSGRRSMPPTPPQQVGRFVSQPSPSQPVPTAGFLGPDGKFYPEAAGVTIASPHSVSSSHRTASTGGASDTSWSHQQQHHQPRPATNPAAQRHALAANTVPSNRLQHNTGGFRAPFSPAATFQAAGNFFSHRQQTVGATPAHPVHGGTSLLLLRYSQQQCTLPRLPYSIRASEQFEFPLAEACPVRAVAQFSGLLDVLCGDDMQSAATVPLFCVDAPRAFTGMFEVTPTMDPTMSNLRRLAFGGDGKPASELFTRDFHAYQTVRNLRDKSLLSVLSLWWLRDELERIRLLLPAEAEAMERMCEFMSMLIDQQYGCFDIADKFNTVIRLGVGTIGGDVREHIRQAKRFQQEHCVPAAGAASRAEREFQETIRRTAAAHAVKMEAERSFDTGSGRARRQYRGGRNVGDAERRAGSGASTGSGAGSAGDRKTGTGGGGGGGAGRGRGRASP